MTDSNIEDTLRRSLDRAAATLPAERTDPSSLDDRVTPQDRRFRPRPLAIAAVAAALLVGIIGAAVATSGSSHQASRLNVTGGSNSTPAPSPSTAAPSTTTSVLPAPPPTSPPAAHAPVPTLPLTTTPPAGTVPGPTTLATPDNTTSTTVSPPAGCNPSSLTVTLANQQGAAGNIAYNFQVTNDGSTACPVGGYFQLSSYDLQNTVITSKSTDTTSTSPQPVNLAPGGSATISALVSISSSTGNSQNCPQIGFFHLTPPNETGSVTYTLAEPSNLNRDCGSISVDATNS